MWCMIAGTDATPLGSIAYIVGDGTNRRLTPAEQRIYLLACSRIYLLPCGRIYGRVEAEAEAGGDGFEAMVAAYRPM